MLLFLTNPIFTKKLPFYMYCDFLLSPPCIVLGFFAVEKNAQFSRTLIFTRYLKVLCFQYGIRKIIVTDDNKDLE